MESVAVAVVEDHPVVIQGILSWIDSDPGQRVRVTQIAGSLAALDAAAGPLPGVIILDLELNGRMVTGAVAGLVAEGRRVVAFSGHTRRALILEVLRAGAHAFVAKDEGRDHLIDAVLTAAANQPYVTRSQARAMLDDLSPDRPVLSSQERAALRLWFQGMSKASVARRMHISENTVKQYINRVRLKYLAVSRPAPTKDSLLVRAVEDGIISMAEVTVYTSYASGSSHD